MHCPKDGKELVTSVYEADVEVDQCPQCNGLWLNQGELERIQETIENDYSEELVKMPDLVGDAYEMAKARLEEDRSCPGCGLALSKREWGFCSQVMIDVCPGCSGIWLDHSELLALEVFFERATRETKEIRRGFFGSLVSLFRS